MPVPALSVQTQEVRVCAPDSLLNPSFSVEAPSAEPAACMAHMEHIRKHGLSPRQLKRKQITQRDSYLLGNAVILVTE